MKNRITFLFLQGLAAGVVAILAQTAQGQVIYNNTGQTVGTSVGTSVQEGNYSFGNNGNQEVGNEIVLGNGSGVYDITSFAVQFFLTGTTLSGNEQVTLNFYLDNGAANSTSGGQQTPKQLIWTSGPSTLSAFTSAAGAALIYTPDVTVTDPDFTWTLTFSGINDGVTGETAGLSIFNSQNKVNGIPVPATGGNYNDAWVNNGGTWSLNQANSGDPGLQFGAIAQTGTPLPVPEPSTIALGVLGACGFLARRRKS